MSSFRRLLDVHPDGTREIFHWNASDHTFAIEYTNNLDMTFTAVREEGADTGGWKIGRAHV